MILRLGDVRIGEEIFFSLVSKEKIDELNSMADEQTKKLLRDIQLTLFDELRLEPLIERSINRLSNISATDSANIRNQVFKIANDLSMDLPSYMF